MGVPELGQTDQTKPDMSGYVWPDNSMSLIYTNVWPKCLA